MKVIDLLKSQKPAMSFEFFPPKSEKAAIELYQTIKDLLPLNPAYVSVTYGAGGHTRDLTHDLVLKINNDIGLCVVSHLTCVGHSQDELYQILNEYDKNGIHNILALRGDPPKGETKFTPHPDGFTYASELVAFIKKNFPHMGIGVAGFPEGHPETPNRLTEMEYFKNKIDAGADYICTQLFFDNRDFYDFKERCIMAGINVPIIAGIMPITTRTGMKRMADLALGSRFPAKLLKAIMRTKDDDQLSKVGIHWACEQVLDLLDNGVDGIHFYTLNKSSATKKVYESIGISRSADLVQENKSFF